MTTTRVTLPAAVTPEILGAIIRKHKDNPDSTVGVMAVMNLCEESFILLGEHIRQGISIASPLGNCAVLLTLLRMFAGRQDPYHLKKHTPPTDLGYTYNYIDTLKTFTDFRDNLGKGSEDLYLDEVFKELQYLSSMYDLTLKECTDNSVELLINPAMDNAAEKGVNEEKDVERQLAKIHEWGVTRNIIGDASAESQVLKLNSGFGELARAVRDDTPLIDHIGDCGVVVMMLKGITGNYEPDSKTSTRKYCILGTYSRMDTALQFASVSSAIGKMSEAISKNKPLAELLVDVMTRLAVLASMNNLKFSECLAHAYAEIKDRDGVMYHGLFVKSTDSDYTYIKETIEKERLLKEKPIAIPSDPLPSSVIDLPDSLG